MDEKVFDPTPLSVEERGRLEAFEADIEKAKQQILESVPDDIAGLGTLIRESVAMGDLHQFRTFLDENDISIKDDGLEYLRDLIIIQRFDLKDLEPSARVRLRQRTLMTENPVNMTLDYKTAVEAGSIPSCMDCRWFINPPSDEERSCVAMGTKGVDQACIGFMVKELET